MKDREVCLDTIGEKGILSCNNQEKNIILEDRDLLIMTLETIRFFASWGENAQFLYQFIAQLHELISYMISVSYSCKD